MFRTSRLGSARTFAAALALILALGAGFFAGRISAAERQPQMRAALVSLKEAKAHLEKATDDKGGHRVAALSHVKKAIAEVEAGIAYDNRR